jgi:excisionase family DNA binding protein
MDLIDYREAAAFVGLSEYTLRRYVSQGRLPHIKLGPKLVRFERQALNCWVESLRIEPGVRGGR